MQAVAVAVAGCYAGWIDDDPPFMYPRLYHGAILEYGIESGDIEWPPEDPDRVSIWALDMWKTDYMTQAFQTAATIDDSYQAFADLWERGKSRSIKAWAQGGIGSVEATGKGAAQLSKLEARCRVPVATAHRMAEDAEVSTEVWVREVAGSLLPPDFEQPVSPN